MKKVIISVIGLSSLFSCKKKEEIVCSKTVFVNGNNKVEFLSTENGMDKININNDIYYFKYNTISKEFSSENNKYKLKGVDGDNIILNDSINLHKTIVNCN